MIQYPFVDWLVSYPKSGNTWVRALLDAYRYQDRFHLNAMNTVLSEPKRSTYMGMWLHSEPFDIYDWACMRPVALRQYVETSRVHEHFILKTHTANVSINEAPLIPAPYTRRALYITRDPRDVLVSASKYFKNPIQKQWDYMRKADHMLGEWDHPQTFQPCLSWRSNVQSWTQEKRFPVAHVRYEDLLQDPVGMFKSILSFYEIRVKDAAVRKAVSLTSFKNMKKAEQEHGFTDNLPAKNGEQSPFFRAGKARQWESELPPALADEVYEEYKDLEPIWGQPK